MYLFVIPPYYTNLPPYEAYDYTKERKKDYVNQQKQNQIKQKRQRKRGRLGSVYQKACLTELMSRLLSPEN